MRQHLGSALPSAQSRGREMSTVGIFAGRGDVILAMALALVVGVWLGWQLHRCYAWFRSQS